MQKVHYQDDHPEVIEAAGGQKYEYISSEGMVKAASESFTKDQMSLLQPDDDHFGMHIIAMGTEEAFPPNRNGDAFPEAALEKYNHTFVKNGCFFREHRNRCQDTQGIGIIKAATFNKPMQRVELIVWGNKRKAEEEYEMAKSGSELSFSMSSRMPHDTCSICGQQSKRIVDYCPHLKDQMLQYIPEMQKYAYAINDADLKFFDISRVRRPADRIAHYIDYKFGSDATMRKMASAGIGVINGAEWAEMEGVNLGDVVSQAFDIHEEAALEKLASVERKYDDVDSGASMAAIEKSALYDVAPAAMQNADFSQEDIDFFRMIDVPSVLGEMTKAGCIMPFPSFASLISGEPKDSLMGSAPFAKVMRLRIPSMFSHAQKSGCSCGEASKMVSPSPYGCMFQQKGDMVQDIMDKAEKSMGMSGEAVKDRTLRVQIIIKKASLADVDTSTPDLDSFYESLANAYTHYVVKSAAQILTDGNKYSMLPTLVVAQNRLATLNK